jgi:hypothetical protein
MRGERRDKIRLLKSSLYELKDGSVPEIML